MECITDYDCYPDLVPSELVQCLSNGICSCDDCFSWNATSNECYLEYPNCYFYNSSTKQCQDERPSQLLALILSLTLSGVGAANFYIGQYNLGGAQLALFLILCIISFSTSLTVYCIGCSIGWETIETYVSYLL